MKSSGELEKLVTKWFSESIAPAASASPSGSASPAPATSEPAPSGGLNLDFKRILPDIPFILAGIPITLAFTITSFILGLIWASILSLLKISKIKILSWFAIAYTSIFRGTPMLLQIAIVYYATPQLTGYNIDPFQAGVLTFTLNSGAYMSETIRGGYSSGRSGAN